MPKVTSMFTVSYGSENRETEIKGYLQKDYTIAVILAAAHFEWTIKRAILALGESPTKSLRATLNGVFQFKTIKKGNLNEQTYDEKRKKTYFHWWETELKWRKNDKRKQTLYCSLGTAVGSVTNTQDAMTVRNSIIHGADNGGGLKKCNAAVQNLIKASMNIRKYVTKNNESVDVRLKARKKQIIPST